MSITSYSQNFEDVMLWRALGHIEGGVYIDIGAQHPIVDSVSLAFHERGWRGVHVEPSPFYARLLREGRRSDRVIEAAVGLGSTLITFFEIPDTGLSTSSRQLAAQHHERGFGVNEIVVTNIPLSDVFALCAGSEVHWLKIDVEGDEESVISSWADSSVRPWIVLVESTAPLTQVDVSAKWEPILVSYGYRLVYFDGLNRFYVSEAHLELERAFNTPPNVFDGFRLNGTASSPFHQLVESRLQEKINQFESELVQTRGEAESQVEKIRASLGELQEMSVAREGVLKERLTAEKEAAEALRSDHARRETALKEQSEQLRADLTSMIEAHADRERVLQAQIVAVLGQADQRLAEMARDRADQDRAFKIELRDLGLKYETALRAAAEREREFASQLYDVRHMADQRLAEMARDRDDQERALHDRIQEREQELRDQGLKHESALRAAAEREREFASQLDDLRNEADQRLAEMARDRADQERALHDRLLERERDFASQLDDLRNEADQRLAEMARDRADQERVLYDRLLEREQELRDQGLKHEAAVRAAAEREREFASQLDDLRNEVMRSAQAMRSTLPWRLSRWVGQLIGVTRTEAPGAGADHKKRGISRFRRGKSRARMLLRLGDSARDRHDWRSAAEAYGGALALEPALPEIWVQLGHAHKEQGAVSEAKVAYERAIELSRYFSDPYLHLGHLNKVNGDFANSWRYYARSFLLDPANRDAAHELRHIGSQAPSSNLDRILDGLTKDAAASGAPGFGLGPPPPKPGPLGRSLDKILKFMRSGGRPVTLSVKLRIRAGDLARDRRDWGASAAAYRQALTRDRTLGHIWIQLGHALKEGGDFVAANTAYLQAADLRQDLGEVALQLGHLCNLIGDITKARVYYARAVMMDGKQIEAAEELHRLVARAGQPDRETLTVFLKGDMSAPGVIEALVTGVDVEGSEKIATQEPAPKPSDSVQGETIPHSHAVEHLSSKARGILFQLKSGLALQQR